MTSATRTEGEGGAGRHKCGEGRKKVRGGVGRIRGGRVVGTSGEVEMWKGGRTTGGGESKISDQETKIPAHPRGAASLHH